MSAHLAEALLMPKGRLSVTGEAAPPYHQQHNKYNLNLTVSSLSGSTLSLGTSVAHIERAAWTQGSRADANVWPAGTTAAPHVLTRGGSGEIALGTSAPQRMGSCSPAHRWLGPWIAAFSDPRFQSPAVQGRSAKDKAQVMWGAGTVGQEQTTPKQEHPSAAPFLGCWS